MSREQKTRNNARLRKQRQRIKETSHADVTLPSSSSSSSTPYSPPDESQKTEIDFERFWSVYPKKVGKRICLKIWKDPKKKKGRPDIETVIKTVEDQKRSEEWKKENGQYIPNPSTWLNQGRWDDELTQKETGDFRFR